MTTEKHSLNSLFISFITKRLPAMAGDSLKVQLGLHSICEQKICFCHQLIHLVSAVISKNLFGATVSEWLFNLQNYETWIKGSSLSHFGIIVDIDLIKTVRLERILRWPVGRTHHSCQLLSMSVITAK